MTEGRPDANEVHVGSHGYLFCAMAEVMDFCFCAMTEVMDFCFAPWRGSWTFARHSSAGSCGVQGSALPACWGLATSIEVAEESPAMLASLGMQVLGYGESRRAAWAAA